MRCGVDARTLTFVNETARYESASSTFDPIKVLSLLDFEFCA